MKKIILGIVAIFTLFVFSVSSNAQDEGTLNGYKWVDLGLSVKWATCNIGAGSPSDYGGYFAWGETSEKNSYIKSNCKTYGDFSVGDIGGNSQYDAATANWGRGWRLPTEYEFQELIEECEWVWTERKGCTGYVIVGPNGNSIFLPAAGMCKGEPQGVGSGGYYWSSTPYRGDDYKYAYLLAFYNDRYFVDCESRGRGQ